MANLYKSVLASGGGVVPTGNAQPADVLAGKTFSNADGIDKTGTMVNNGAVSATVAAGQSYTIPAGYHNGSGTVTGTPETLQYEVLASSTSLTLSITLTKDYKAIALVYFEGTTATYNGTGTVAATATSNAGSINCTEKIISNAKNGDTITSNGYAWSAIGIY